MAQKQNVSIDGGNDWGGLGRIEGGNCAKGKGEAHGGGSATRVVIDGAGTENAKTFGPTRQNGDGNEVVTGEQHGDLQSFYTDPARVTGREFVTDNSLGNRLKGGTAKIPANIQVDDRGEDNSGNSSHGPREKVGQKKAERVLPSQRW